VLQMRLQVAAWYSVDSRLSCSGTDCCTSQHDLTQGQCTQILRGGLEGQPCAGWEVLTRILREGRNPIDVRQLGG
jgi:hypothetical protein